MQNMPPFSAYKMETRRFRMSVRRILVPAVFSCLLLVCCVSSFAETPDGSPENGLGVTPPGDVPTPFLPEVFSDGAHSAPTFTADGTEMYWSQSPEGNRSLPQHVFMSRLIDGRWSPPELAPFSGSYSDGGPFVSPDSKKLFFYSNRPTESGGTPSDGDNSDIWYTERVGEAWGEPRRLPFNTDRYEGMASVAANGNIYFQSNRSGTRGIFDVWVSEWIDGGYSTPRNLGSAVNCPQITFSPLIAPDESFIILAYANNAPNNGLYISFRKPDGGWTKAISMGQQINTSSPQRFPGLSPDQRQLFFTRASRGKESVYWVDSGIVDLLRNQSGD
jgi:hypothetical protein